MVLLIYGIQISKVKEWIYKQTKTKTKTFLFFKISEGHWKRRVCERISKGVFGVWLGALKLFW